MQCEDLAPVFRVQGLNRPSRMTRRETRPTAEAISEAALRELFAHQRRLELVGLIAAHANESRRFLDALQFTLDQVCAYTGWPVAHAYVVGTNDDRPLRSTGRWHVEGEPGSFDALRTATSTTSLDPNSDLIAGVIFTGRPVWIADVGAEPGFTRRVSGALGVRACFAIPVLIGREVVAILELFSKDALAPDPWLQNTMVQVGTQLARVYERECAEVALRELALHDDLTGLPNRRLFMERLEHAYRRLARRTGQTFAVMFLDLDRFKQINDTLGHAAGDELLVALAKRLTNCLRPGDVVARLGGDEFVILLEDIAGVRDAVRVADRIKRALTAPVLLSGADVFVTVSIGIAVRDSIREGAAEILRAADAAMYKAKASGRSLYRVCEGTMNDLPRKPPSEDSIGERRDQTGGLSGAVKRISWHRSDREPRGCIRDDAGSGRVRDSELSD
jgi:diguanylate cyclase (GGDEF)-like protein